MLSVWEAPLSRPTMDIDLLGRIHNSVEAMIDFTRAICRQKVEPDGISFDEKSIKGERITVDADYEGDASGSGDHWALHKLPCSLISALVTL